MSSNDEESEVTSEEFFPRIYQKTAASDEPSTSQAPSGTPSEELQTADLQLSNSIKSNLEIVDSEDEDDVLTCYQEFCQYRGASRRDWSSEGHGSSYREPVEIFRHFEPQLARIDLNQEQQEDHVSNLKNEVNDFLVDCVAAEDKMKLCLTTIAQNSRRLDEFEKKLSSMNDKEETTTQEAIVSELFYQIRTARLKQNELKNQLASFGLDGRKVSGGSMLASHIGREELGCVELSVFQAVLEINCDNVIAICKGEYKQAKLEDQSQNEGKLGASILHHFLRIEASILKFQRISALRRIGKEVLEKKEQKTRILSDRVVQFHRGGLRTDLIEICTELKTLRNELNNILSLRRMSFVYFSFENHYQELFLSGKYTHTDIDELLVIPDFVLDVLMYLEMTGMQVIEKARAEVAEQNHVLKAAEKFLATARQDMILLDENGIMLEEKYNTVREMINNFETGINRLNEPLIRNQYLIISRQVEDEKKLLLEKSSEICLILSEINVLLRLVLPNIPREKLLEIMDELMSLVSDIEETASSVLAAIRDHCNDSMTLEKTEKWGELTGKVYWTLTAIHLNLPTFNLSIIQTNLIHNLITHINSFYMPRWWVAFLEVVGKEKDVESFWSKVYKYRDELKVLTEQVEAILGYD
ncbi:hypothetical protein GCK72_015964 [Caenorhabditis remanei]|uniref:Uncharacterized protein n=1 Tax=Caenorhabditis remanei TaxID=31234 RepID=A0A6A5GWE3_CAERE|nr:hypothetical protein GCK72_015964 [Caenorhabditis remanei]KAF1759497.1 hypothetical protein GCK72_015964 [Caenorhabditis remanei]